MRAFNRDCPRGIMWGKDKTDADADGGLKKAQVSGGKKCIALNMSIQETLRGKQMTPVYNPYDQEFVRLVRNGGPDANGQIAERSVSDGAGNPCRSCLEDIPESAEMLILAARPFPSLQPYAETGPIFLCADECSPWDGQGVPPVLRSSPDYLLKAYSEDDRIIYGTGKIVTTGDLNDYALALLERSNVAYVDVRSARNNCFQTRITRTR